APVDVARGAVGRGEAPDVFAVVRETRGELLAKPLLRARGGTGLREKVHPAHRVAMRAPIEPGLWKLVHEERRVMEESLARVVDEGLAPPRPPHLGRHAPRGVVRGEPGHRVVLGKSVPA